MASEQTMIPFEIEVSRILEVVARQIYQSPLALLRENAQNAYDAILIRKYQGDNFVARIDITISSRRIVVRDNGIGMDEQDLRQHFWRAGSSGKNNPEAKAAGVVGTFGIGAMANFGVARTLTVVTEKLGGSCRLTSRAEKATLSTSENCITLESSQRQESPGTEITAEIDEKITINVDEAVRYVAEFTALVPVDVYVNEKLVSGQSIDELVPKVPAAWSIRESDWQIGGFAKGEIELLCSANGEIWMSLVISELNGEKSSGRLILRQGQQPLKTYRSGFGLAPVNLVSVYHFGGVADLPSLQPTAGREALTNESVQFLQRLFNEIETFVSLQIGNKPESHESTPFMEWVVRHKRFDLCEQLRITVSPGAPITLLEVKIRSENAAVNVYEGDDAKVIRAYASEDNPLLRLARSKPRRICENNYLNQYCNVLYVSDSPQVTELKGSLELSMAEMSLAGHIQGLLSSDYFLQAEVKFGKISHNLQALLDKTTTLPTIILNPGGQTVALVLGLYDTEIPAFSSMVKDFVRAVIFPLISELVPSSTRQGAEAFLKTIRRSREVFEYEFADTSDLASIWSKYNEGEISMEEAVSRSSMIASGSVQVVEANAARSAREVVPDIVENEEALEKGSPEVQHSLDPSPGIARPEISSSAKLLIIAHDEPPLRGYRCFLSVTERAQKEFGEFFLQPHSTSVVWGGLKAVFIFQHHSGRFGLYYDMMTGSVIAAETGGMRIPTCTIVLKDKIYIPIPEPIQTSFIPTASERKRFEVRFDILYTTND